MRVFYYTLPEKYFLLINRTVFEKLFIMFVYMMFFPYEFSVLSAIL